MVEVIFLSDGVVDSENCCIFAVRKSCHLAVNGYYHNLRWCGFPFYCLSSLIEYGYSLRFGLSEKSVGIGVNHSKSKNIDTDISALTIKKQMKTAQKPQFSLSIPCIS